MPQVTTETSGRTPLAPVSSGYADVNGIKLYHEVYGRGEPLVLASQAASEPTKSNS
jgi:hypothetical protein